MNWVRTKYMNVLFDLTHTLRGPSLAHEVLRFHVLQSDSSDGYVHRDV